MKQKDTITTLFERLKGEFDLGHPAEGHQQRFLEKLNKSSGTVALSQKNKSWWKPLTVAASIVVMAVLGFTFLAIPTNREQRMVDISPEASKTQFYFAGLIEEQVQLLKNEKSPETEKLVLDALNQLGQLKKDYEKLEKDLIGGGDSKLILNAMIINYQTRIDLLQEVLKTIDRIKNYKKKNNENDII